MMPDFFIQMRPNGAMTPSEYRRHFEQEVGRVRQAPEASLKEHDRYLELNLARTVRVEKTYEPSSALKMAAGGIQEEQLWMVLTEPWCGDSAQSLACLFKIAACSARIEVQVLLRDRNLDIMDAYLSDGVRSIPKLVAFDRQGGELFRWGPRPKAAADLFQQLKESGSPIEEVREKLHLWYGRNRGRALDGEFVELLTERR